MATPSGSGFVSNYTTNVNNDVQLVYAKNIDLSGNPTHGLAANILQTDGQLIIGNTTANVYGSHAHIGKIFVNGVAAPIDGSGNIAITAASADLHTARYIVSTGGSSDGATHTTITAAYAAAVAAGGVQTVFIQPGTYTENLTLSPNVNLSAYTCDAITPNVTIIGKISASFTGTATISNVRLQTNSDFCLVLSSANATNLYLFGCNINVLSGTGISITNSAGSSAKLHLYYCSGGTAAGTLLFNKSGNCELKFYYGTFGGPGDASIVSGTGLDFNYSIFNNAVTNSGAAPMVVGNSTIFNITTSGSATISSSNSFLGVVTLAGTGTLTAANCYFGSLSPTVTALIIGAGTTANLTNCTIDSSNAAAISGAGTINYAGLNFINTSSSITVTTQTNLKAGPSETFGSSNSGLTNTLTVTNTSNTATSAANIVANVAGGTAADASHQATITAGQAWTWGLDNSDSDAWVLASSAALGTTNVMRVSTSGEINFPLQSAFFAQQSSAANDVTGSGAAYTLGTTVDLTEIFDQNSDFDPATGVYTAPVTGRCSFSVGVLVGQLTAAMTLGQINLVTSNRTFAIGYVNCAAARSVSTAADLYGWTGTCFTDMDAADTTSALIQINGGVGNTADLVTGPGTGFGGYLAC